MLSFYYHEASYFSIISVGAFYRSFFPALFRPAIEPVSDKQTTLLLGQCDERNLLNRTGIEADPVILLLSWILNSSTSPALLAKSTIGKAEENGINRIEDIPGISV